MDWDVLVKPRRLGELLLRRGMIAPEQLDVALAERRITRKHLGQILIARRWLNYDQLHTLLTEQEWIETELAGFFREPKLLVYQEAPED